MYEHDSEDSEEFSMREDDCAEDEDRGDEALEQHALDCFDAYLQGEDFDDDWGSLEMDWEAVAVSHDGYADDRMKKMRTVKFRKPRHYVVTKHVDTPYTRIERLIYHALGCTMGRDIRKPSLTFKIKEVCIPALFC